MKIKHPLRLTAISLFMIGLSTAIVITIIKVINNDNYAEIEHLRTAIIQAERGNIYTYDYQLLAVNTLKYELRFDGNYADASEEELKELSRDLARILKNKSQDEYFNALKEGESDGYYLLHPDVSVFQIGEIKKTSFYNKDRYFHGGLIIKEKPARIKTNSNTAARTIGDLYNDFTPKYGLEYSYNSELSGVDGKSLVLDENKYIRQLSHSTNIKPEPGQDLITTLELDYQDILEQALIRQLEEYDANFGVAILMEVQTGQIKAISNLKKIQSNKYADQENFSVKQLIEPGSTFKMASLMAYLEDTNGDINDTIDCKNGEYRFKGAQISTIDSESLGRVSIKEAFAKSSNIGVARLITNHYAENPDAFINRLYHFGLGEQSKIDLIGVSIPEIKFSNDISWSGVSLPWISYGYEIGLTPIDILTFYNTVANNGYIVHPYLGHSFRTGSKSFKIERNYPSHTICSESTIEKIKLLLREVVLTGTANSLNNLPFPVSGKTGTTVQNYGSPNQAKEYQASFVGYFPSNAPKYSCFVLIDTPNKEKGFYGSQVAVPVFKEIAEQIYLKEGLKWSPIPSLNSRSITHSLKDVLDEYYNREATVANNYPSVVGLHIRDAVFLLENAGYHVIVKGNFGYVKKQYPKPNTPIKNDLAITLFI